MNYKYTLGIIKYIPDIDRNEIINVGIAMHNTELQFLKSTFINNYDRLKKFDDEIDLDFFKIYTSSIEQEFNFNLFNVNTDLSSPNLLQELSKNYVNQFRFDFKIIDVSNPNANEVFEQYAKLMLHFDYPKNARLSKAQKTSLVEKLFSLNNIQFEILKNYEVQGYYNENLNADYRVGNKLIKVFEINEKNYNNYIEHIKSWAFNALKLKNTKKQVVFVMIDSVDNLTTEKYKAILSETAELFTSFDDPELLSLLANQNNYLEKFIRN